jgi:integrase
MHMGRPRAKRKDLPPGLHQKPDGTYYWQPTRGNRSITTIGKVDKATAWKAWVKLSRKVPDKGERGTVAELIEAYTLELARRVRIDDISKVTAAEYTRQLPKLRELFGAKEYALTPAQSMDHDVLRKSDIGAFLRQYEGQRGAVWANRMVALLSAIFSHACGDAGMSTYNPCLGVRRNKADARKNVLPDTSRATLVASLNGAPRLIAAFADVTGMRKTDIRLLLLSHISDVIRVQPSKTKRTGTSQEWEITPAIRVILDEAAKLPGRARSLYVFPTRRGTPYSESALQSAWYRMMDKTGIEGATFRDFRTSELNSVHREGGDATKQAGHADARTTKAHYLKVADRIKARK